MNVHTYTDWIRPIACLPALGHITKETLMRHKRYDCDFGCPVEACVEVIGGK